MSAGREPKDGTGLLGGAEVLLELESLAVSDFFVVSLAEAEQSVRPPYKRARANKPNDTFAHSRTRARPQESVFSACHMASPLGP